MKVAISSIGKDLNSQIDPRFGRCRYFIIVETEDMSFEVFENTNLNLSGGVGIQSASFVSSKGSKAVLTGNCGPKAMQTLMAGGIEVYIGQMGTVKESVENYKKGGLQPVNEANVTEKFGAGGMGGGRGMGMGGGRGMGRGMRGGMFVPDGEVSGGLAKEESLTELKEKAAELKKQMEDIDSRIKNLEQKRK